MSAIHATRAKKWGTNPFVAEWFAAAAAYCQTNPEGKRAFNAWLVTEYGSETAKQKLLDCQKPPAIKKSGATGTLGLFNSAASDLYGNPEHHADGDVIASYIV
ncbi:hypothetical protein R3P38DRAFT_2909457 [Favolaschia claudopus]|uniref:Uncharacterized protein n=1 Tax=Favolaschia claudopus TaxID=2862362 RepID=A0AAW0CAS1_9AGAR